ncbi:MAG: nucleotidyltransferase family protein [Gammaproteobacteria bacterium]|nr:nucleotidyltransferase family protein [Gammaproteobacteria bacterium]
MNRIQTTDSSIMAIRNPNSLWAIVLAAGTASRFGRPKLLESYGGEPLICRALRAAHHVAAGRVVLVTGHNNKAVELVANGLFDEAVYNPAFADGLGSSIAAGVRHCRGRAEAVLLLLADQPLIDGAYLEKLIEKWCCSDADIIMSEYNDTIGPPAIFSKSTFESLAVLSGDEGARPIVKSGRYNIATMGEQIENPDIDKPEDLQ